MESNGQTQSDAKMKFNPNDPKHWKDFDPFAKAEEYIDGKSEAKINIARANKLKAENPITYANISNANKQKAKDPAYGRKISEALTGRKNGPKAETIKKAISQSLTGIPKTQKHIKALSESHKGKIPHNKGKSISEEQKKQISKSRKGKATIPAGTILAKIICPHCGKEGGGGMMKRWHFDNCKHK